MRRFRFKTLEEFGGKIPEGWNQPFMVPFLGRELKNLTNLGEIFEAYDKNLDRFFNYRDTGITQRIWGFRVSDLVEIKETMERLAKSDWDYNITTNDIIGVEMQTGKKYFLQFNAGGIVPVNLKEHENNYYSDTTNLESILTTAVDKLIGNKKVYGFNSMQDMVIWATT